MDEAARQCAELINDSKNVVALTGAGISTSCGIPDFRGPRGLYVTRQYDPEKVFDINHFRKDPKPFFEFAQDFLNLQNNLQPSFSHRFLASLEKKGKLSGLITQNIDLLHQKAGSQSALEIHGSFWKSYCQTCGKKYSFEETAEKIFTSGIPMCEDGIIKPDIVFFGENVKRLDEAIAMCESADLLLVIGSSCVVQPAAGLPGLTSGKVIVINLQPVDLGMANVVLQVNQDMDEFLKAVEFEVG